MRLVCATDVSAPLTAQSLALSAPIPARPILQSPPPERCSTFNLKPYCGGVLWLTYPKPVLHKNAASTRLFSETSGVNVMKRHARALGLISVALAMCWTVSANATTLSISPDPLVASGGNSVLTSVDYTAQGAQVASLQFDLLYDPGVLSITTATAGSGVINASKTLSENLISPGNLRFIISGFNQNVFGGGSVATLTVQVSNSARMGAHFLFLCNIVASDPNGLSVPIKVTGATNKNRCNQERTR